METHNTDRSRPRAGTLDNRTHQRLPIPILLMIGFTLSPFSLVVLALAAVIYLVVRPPAHAGEASRFPGGWRW